MAGPGVSHGAARHAPTPTLSISSTTPSLLLSLPPRRSGQYFRLYLKPVKLNEGGWAVGGRELGGRAVGGRVAGTNWACRSSCQPLNPRLWLFVRGNSPSSPLSPHCPPHCSLPFPSSRRGCALAVPRPVLPRGRTLCRPARRHAGRRHRAGKHRCVVGGSCCWAEAAAGRSISTLSRSTRSTLPPALAPPPPTQTRCRRRRPTATTCCATRASSTTRSWAPDCACSRSGG